MYIHFKQCECHIATVKRNVCCYFSVRCSYFISKMRHTEIDNLFTQDIQFPWQTKTTTKPKTPAIWLKCVESANTHTCTYKNNWSNASFFVQWKWHRHSLHGSLFTLPASTWTVCTIHICCAKCCCWFESCSISLHFF